MPHAAPRRLLLGVALSGLCLLGTWSQAWAQEPYQIQGTVVNEGTAEPLPSVQVLLQGTSIGTLTDAAGRYSLEAAVRPGTYTLRFILIGHADATRQVELGDERTIQVPEVGMRESAVQLDEIVVTGTGVQAERRAVGNTVASISGDEVNEAPAATSIDRALQGKIAGAVITQNNGQPGGGVSIRLRGTSSILGGAEPLIVIDGVIVENNSSALVGLGANASYGGAAMGNRLADIPPSDIERIVVLKGAAAAALYGSRANNGVIQIFTRRGRTGEPVITLSSENTWSSVPERYDLLESPLAGPGDVIFGPADDIGEPVTRYLYQDQLFRTGFGTNNQVALSGGTEGTQYYLSGSWMENSGAIRGTDFGRVGARARLTQRINNWLEVGASANFLQTESNFVPEGEQTQGVTTTLIFTPTTFNPFFDENLGRYPYSPIISTNPFDVIENWKAEGDVNRFLGNIEANVTPLSNLRFTMLFGLDDSREEFVYLQPPFSLGASYAGSLQNPIRSIRRYNTDITASHDADLTESVSLTSTAGFRHTFDRTNTVRAAALGLNPGQGTIGGGGATPSASQSIAEITTLGGFLQERVSIGDRLYLTGGLNIEASSAFGEDERWQMFPRVSGSYVLSDEPFFQESSLGNLFSTLRLRAAYGQTGGQPPGAYFRFSNYGNIAHADRVGFVPSTLAGNPDLKPERQREWEGGFEMGLFEDRLGLEFTYYDQVTNDLVLSVPLPYSSGFTSQYQNIGEVSNKGVELTLNALAIESDNFSWSSRVIYSHNRNKVVDLGAATDSVNYAYLNYVVEGEPIGVFYGAYYPRDEQGNIIYFPRVGTSNTPIYDASICGTELNVELGCLPTRARDESGRVLTKKLGDPNPDFTLSWGNDFQFGNNVELSVLLDGRFGNDVANFSRRISDYFGVSSAIEGEISGELPVLRNPTTGAVVRTYHFLNLERHLLYEEFVEDASYVKLREIALRYNVPQSWANRIGASAATITLAGRNLHTWTDYKGIDPEINLFSANTVARGVDFATSPIPRTFAAGFTLTF
ncbi:MAG TPA: TonB-dependent receptor [Longimicrobiales bacterium]|nr:TonB-dependent receptor [Longimicrobiales bacterium]